MTRYKVGRFHHAINVVPGDTLNVSLKECYPDGTTMAEHKVEEKITVSQVVTYWVMFYVPGVGFGGMFCGEDIEERIGEVFVDPVKVEPHEPLFEDPYSPTFQLQVYED